MQQPVRFLLKLQLYLMKGGVIFAEAFCPTLNIFNLWSFILFQKILQHFKNISDHGFSAQILYVLVILFLLTIIVLIMITSIQHGYFEFFKNTVFMGVVFNVNSREVMRVVKRPREMDWSNFVFLLFLFFSAFILLHLLGYFFWYKKKPKFSTTTIFAVELFFVSFTSSFFFFFFFFLDCYRLREENVSLPSFPVSRNWYFVPFFCSFPTVHPTNVHPSNYPSIYPTDYPFTVGLFNRLFPLLWQISVNFHMTVGHWTVSAKRQFTMVTTANNSVKAVVEVLWIPFKFLFSWLSVKNWHSIFSTIHLFISL